MMSIANKALRNLLFSGMLAVAGMTAIPLQAVAVEEINLDNGVAVHGYDVVSYFTQGKPVSGSKDFTTEYQEATYRFSSAAHRDKFVANPAKFAPQYGGFCAFGTAMGRKFNGDPKVWKIVNDKLYLNLNKKVQTRWQGNIPGFLKGANNNWPVILHVADAQLEASPPAGLTQGAQ